MLRIYSIVFFALYALSLRWMEMLAPGRDHSELARANVTVILENDPLYANELPYERSLALLLAIEFRESGFTSSAVGDGGTSFCSMQINSGTGGHPGLLSDPLACVRAGYRLLRMSIAIDREHPIAWYARGGSYRSREAIRLSNDRVALSKKILALSPE